jgi:hypothetical protein
MFDFDRVRAQARNNSTTLLVFAPVYGVAPTGTYPDMHRRIRFVDEPKSGAIWWNYFLHAPLYGGKSCPRNFY